MKKITNYFLLLIGFTLFGIFIVGCNDSSSNSSNSNEESYSSDDDHNSYYEDDDYDYYDDYDEKVCQDVYGNWHSSISTCYTCGISYCTSSLPYGKYCSQSCCGAYEGLSSKCGYY